MDTDRPILSRCRTRVQATVLVSRLEAAGVAAEIDAGPGIRGGFDVRVAASDLEQARAVLNRLAGRDAPLGLLDVRRLIPALLVLAVLLALLVFLAKLVT